MANQSNNDPMKYKTGKVRLGPLTMAQLVDMLAKASRPKDRAKITNRINILKKRPGYKEPVAAAVSE